MEEKERYKWSQDVIVECPYEDYDYIVDTENNIIFNDDNYFKLVDLLNQQDKELSKLRASYQQVKEENSQLKQQLEEKDKEIEELKAQRHIYLNRSVEECNKITDLEFELQHKDQDKISFAVEQLEKVKENIKKVPIIDFDLSGNFEKMYKQDAIRQIDNQIKELKGEE